LSRDEQFLRIGRIIGAHGLHGRLKVLVITDIRERFEIGSCIYLKVREEYRRNRILDFIEQKGRQYLISLEGISDRDAALSLKGIEIFIERDEAEKTRHLLGEDTYYYYDIIGCSVYLESELFGRVTDILEAGAGEVLVVEDSSGKEFLIPFVHSMVDTRELFKRKIYIYPIEGLIE
jgi:16S rRNA processing protein RimM